jgi:hypothetical protein
MIRSNKQIGYLSAHCHVVAKEGSAWVAMCTKHLDWSDGSTMTAHSTEMITPGAPIRAKMVVAGEGAILKGGYRVEGY